jgi:predicted dienelactone hydrolase
MHKLLWIWSFLLLPVCAQYKPADGPVAIATAADVVLKDAARHKNLHLRVQYPEAAGTYPVILFSHGAGGSKDGYVGLTSFWAKHGYVTIQPSHADSLALRLDLRDKSAAEKRAMAGTVTQLDDPKAWEDRVRDLSLIMDSLDEIVRQAPGLAGKMNRALIGVGGHSFGAGTTLTIGGALLDIPNGPSRKRYTDPRVKALLVVSGQGKDRFGFTEHSWAEIRLPMMSMTGSRDFGYKEQTPDWRREAYRGSPAGDKYDVFIEGATHMTFSGRLVESGQEKPALFEYAKLSSLGFWDAYLKKSDAAKVWLVNGSIEGESKGVVRIRHR